MQARTLTQQISQLEARIDRIARRSSDVAALLSSQLNDLETAAGSTLDIDEDIAALRANVRSYYEIFYGFGEQAA